MLFIPLVLSSQPNRVTVTKEHTTLQPPNKMPLDAPRQQLRLLLQFLRIVLAKMNVFGLGRRVQCQNVVGRLQLGHGHEPDGTPVGQG